MRQSNIEVVFFSGLLLLVLVITLKMFEPYLITLAMAATLAVVLQPLYRILNKWTRGREGIAALFTVIVTGLCLLLPLSLIATKVFWETQELYHQLVSGGDGPEAFLRIIEARIESYIPSMATIDLHQYAGQTLQWFAANVGVFFAGTLRTFLHIVLGAVAFFFLLKDGGRFVRSIIALSPLTDNRDERILSTLEKAVNSIMKGSLLIAVLQGVATGVGLLIFGVPSAALWGSLAAISALLPGLGTGLVIIPAVIYLVIVDHTGAAIGLSVWGFAIVGLIDNILCPILVSQGVNIHSLFILFAVIGGLEFFGPVGFILGPLLLSLLYALLEIYRPLLLKEEALVTSSLGTEAKG